MTVPAGRDGPSLGLVLSVVDVSMKKVAESMGREQFADSLDCPSITLLLLWTLIDNCWE